MPITVAADNLGKRFNREWIFRNFNYQFNPGRVYAITGPNGSGKSTLLQVLWGQMQPSEGTVRYSVKESSEVYQSVSIAAPYMELIDEFTLEEMVGFHFKFKKSRLPVDSIIDTIELNASRKKAITSFSSGMKQRLKLALAFYSDTDLLFLDEPCTNLDKKSVDWYTGLLNGLSSSVTTFIASNQADEYPDSAVRVDILDYKKVTSVYKR